MPCQNNGVCTDGNNTYTCACVAGFTGRECETSNYTLDLSSKCSDLFAYYFYTKMGPYSTINFYCVIEN